MSSPGTVLLTGAAGRVGTMLRERLPGYGYRLRLLDRVPLPSPVPGEDALVADLHDTEALRRAVRGTDAVVHLAALPAEDTFDAILRTNIVGTYHVYEAARAEGILRVVYASSVHATGFAAVPAPDEPRTPVSCPHRPDTYYGLSKCFGEDLAQLYWDRAGIETVSLRIGSCADEPPPYERSLSTWLSPGDCARLVHAALTAPEVGHTVVYGASANTRGWFDLGPARALGYEPRDDAERYAERILADPAARATDHDRAWLGGPFTTGPGPWPPAAG
ncbi:NAD-dependent epimerase/dehydratase family protein [Streptomyces aidingensis]|uniref:Uronate dehydrogenase n=1 Tax=Streptomyces aidingensis TaxID=910347 RepID=A0A1I1MCM4_9ACTN|nr:NAD(P)-dependent oxidoreductase [Streptomyces aidingensis]SFC80393.1 uronate dehydrogenase [Streptomyces aidingensis]